MKRQHADFRDTVVDETRRGHERSHTTDADDVTLLCFEHAGKELLDQDEVR